MPNTNTSKESRFKVVIPAQAQKKILSALINIAYFWASEENFEMSMICYNSLNKFPLSKKQKIKMQELKQYINSTFKDELKDKKKSPNNIILYRDNFSLDENIYCTATSFVLNLFCARVYPLALDFFFEISAYYPEIGAQTLYALKEQKEIKEELKTYLGSYILFYGQLADVDVQKGIDIKDLTGESDPDNDADDEEDNLL